MIQRKQDSIATSPAEPTGVAETALNGRPATGSTLLEGAARRAFEGSVRPLPDSMTITQAAEFLDVSRSFVVQLIKRNELPFQRVGKRCQIPSDALLAYREKMFQQANTAADEMVQSARELGLYEEETPLPLL